MTRFRFHADGTFDVLDEQRAVLERATASCSFQATSGELFTVTTSERLGDTILRGAEGGVQIQLKADGDRLTLSVRNDRDMPIRLDVCNVLDCDVSREGAIHLDRASKLCYLHHGWQSWSHTAIRSMHSPELPYEEDEFAQKHLPHGAPVSQDRTSDSFMHIGGARGEYGIFLGFEGATRQFSQIRCKLRDETIVRLRAVAYGDSVRLDAASSFRSETLAVCFGDLGKVYDEYARRVAAAHPRRGSLATVQGWCSWYYYYGENTTEDVRRNLGAILANQLPLDLVLIDDGYEMAIGDWTNIDHHKFPDGMQAAAEEIHRAGKRAGIWLAPFGAAASSQLALRRPEFLLRGEDGQPVLAWNHGGERIYALDLTRPDVAGWLRELFDTVCRVWQFDAVKLDFVFAGALPGKRYDAAMTRAQAYRRGLQLIADQIGSAKLILGCGAPQLASVGLVDTMRVSQDVHFTWEPGDPRNLGSVSTRHAVQNTLLRAPFNQRLWLNDPDCVIVRPRGDLNAMTRNENRTLASVAALTASVLIDSDNLAQVAPSYLDDLVRVLPALEKTARVRRWFQPDGAHPSELELALDDGRWVLAVLNWSGRARPASIELPDDRVYHVYDFWARRYLGMHQSLVQLTRHAPHQTIVLQCAPVDAAPALVGSSFHIAAANVTRMSRDESGLKIELGDGPAQRGELVVSLPPQHRIRRAARDGKRVAVRHRAPHIAHIRFLHKPGAMLELEF